MNKANLSRLNGFSGTENYYRHAPRLWYTDGVKYLCENADCYWLLDVINSYQSQCRKDKMLCSIQFWILRPNKLEAKEGKVNNPIATTYREKADAHVVCERDSDDIAIVQEIEFTDFPFDALSEVKLYVQDNGSAYIVCLPSEY